MGKKEVSFMIVDDHPIFRAGLTQLINQENNFKVIAEAGNAKEALDKFNTVVPDFAVIDISLKGMNGLELIKSLKIIYPDLLILVVSMHDESLYAERILRAGAKGYIMKHEASKKVINAVYEILSGKIYISETVKEKMIQGMVNGFSNTYTEPINKLSDREFEVFQLIGQGLGTSNIASKLNLSVKTIETYCHHIKTKLIIKNVSELRQYAIKWVQSHSP